MDLPNRHTKEEITTMIENLQRDLEQCPELGHAEKVHRFSTKHKELLFSYPMLYRTVCRGTYRPTVLNTIMELREMMESGQLDRKQAVEELVKKSVDDVKGLSNSTS